MKKLIVFALLITFVNKSFSQKMGNINTYVGTYFWTDAVQLQYCDQYGNLDDKLGLTSAYYGLRFNIVRSNDNMLVIKVLDFKADSTKKDVQRERKIYTYNIKETKEALSNFFKSSSNNLNRGSDQLYFKVSIEAFKKYAIKYSRINGSLALGAVNFPFRYRLQKGKGDFSGAFNLGAATGYKLPRDSSQRWSLTLPVLSFSISNINIDSVSATKNQGLLKSTNNFTALSIATGVILENNKIQIGAFIGWDVLSRVNQLQYGWIYQQKPWISIGIGYSIFSSDKASSTSADGNK